MPFHVSNIFISLDSSAELFLINRLGVVFPLPGDATFDFLFAEVVLAGDIAYIYNVLTNTYY